MKIKGLVSILLLGFMVSCSEGFSEREDFEIRLTTPTADVVANVTASSLLVNEDVEFFTEELRTNISTYLQLDSENGNSRSIFLTAPSIKTVSEEQDIVLDIEEWITELNGIQSECNFGGSRQVTGTGVVTMNSNRSSGTIIGDFAIEYSNCQMQATYDAKDGVCAIVPTLNGAVAGTVEISFSVQGDTINNVTAIEIDSDPVAVTVNQTQTDQSFQIQYELESSSNDNGFVGEVNYKSNQYDIPSIEFTATTLAKSVACPPPPEPEK